MIVAATWFGAVRAVYLETALPFSKKATTAGRRCSLRKFSPSVMRLLDSSDDARETGAQLDVRSFHALLEAQAKSRQGGCGKRALDILSTWEHNDSSSLSSKQEKRELKNPDLQSSLDLLRSWEEKNAPEKRSPQGPDLRGFILAVHALSNDPIIPRGQKVAQAQELYERAKSKYIIMMKQQLTDPSDSSSSSSSSGKEQLEKLQLALLELYVLGVAEELSYAERADALLTEMEDETGTTSSFAYNRVLQAWKLVAAHHSDKCPEAILRARAVLDRMSKRSLSDRVSYSTYLGTLANQRSTEAAQEANEILDTMNQMYTDTGNVAFKADAQTVSSVMSAWVKCGQPQRAQQLLDRMEADYLRENHKMSSGADIVAPNVFLYNIVMDGWAKSGCKDAAKKTQQVFERMQQMYQQGNLHAQPDVFSYTIFLGACAKANNAEFAQTAEDVFLRIYNEYRQGDHSLKLNTQIMTNEYRQGDHSLKLNTQIMTMVISAWVRCGQPERAQQLLDRMEIDSSNSGVMAPNAFSYNIVMDGWAKSGRKDAAKKTQQVFERMQQMHQQGNVHARPSIVSYTTFLSACAKADDVEFAQTAENVFLQIYNEYQQGDRSLELNTKIMNVVILAWVRCRQPQRAQQLLDRMEKASSSSHVLAPDVFAYNIVMDGWAKSGRKDAAEKAQQVFERMQQMHQQGNVHARPSIVSYTTFISACAKADNAELAQTAENALFQMHEQYKQGDCSLKPNKQTVNTVSSAWLRCGQPERAEQLLDRMEELVR